MLPKLAVIKLFSKVVPEIARKDIRYAYKLNLKPRQVATPPVHQLQADAPTDMAPAKPPPTIVIVRFNDINMRNKVFYLSRKNKDKLPKDIIVRDDQIKTDYDKWCLAKPQMNEAHTQGRRSRYKWGNLVIAGTKTKIQGDTYLPLLNPAIELFPRYNGARQHHLMDIITENIPQQPTE